MPIITNSRLNNLQNSKELYLVLGGIPLVNTKDFNSNYDPTLIKRISENEKISVGLNNIWQYGKIYNPYETNISSNYYVLNELNNVVYICLSNNTNNIKNDQSNPSLFIPTTETPQIQKLDDGYSWFPVFRVDLSHYNFLSNTDLPIPRIQINNDYNTFSDKYKPLCSSGVTSFGTCCLYFKEAGYDDISGITHAKGELSNENVFSTCYDCQKLGDALKREARFSKLTGTTGITLGSTGGCPGCAKNVVIKGTLSHLEDNINEIMIGSSNEFAYNCMSTFTNTSGIMAATIDLDSLSLQQRTITTENPTVNVIDPDGVGAIVKLKTTQITYNQYRIIGIEIISSGTGYSIPDHKVTNTLFSNPINTAIYLTTFPIDLFEYPQNIIPIKYQKISTTIDTTESVNLVAVQNFTKYAILADPLTLTGEVFKNTENSSNYYSLEKAVILGVAGAASTVVNMATTPPPQYPPINYNTILTNSQNVRNNNNSEYQVYVSAIKGNANGNVNYLASNGTLYSVNGVVIYTTDTSNSVNLGDEIYIGTNAYVVKAIDDTVQIDKNSGYYLTSGLLNTSISNIETETRKRYTFDIRIGQ